jgi:catechol 2,3-dioxygenase-like lactoylglutathione lyase family enzyme
MSSAVFDHVTIRVSDRTASERFYETVLGALGRAPTYRSDVYVAWDDFGLLAADVSSPATTRLHVGFAAPRLELVDAFWRAGVEAGFESDGEPGARPEYGPDYVGAFLVDPDGNSAEAVSHGSLRSGGTIDHLWIRVVDVVRARDFYAAVAPFAGFELRGEPLDPPRARFSGGNGSFSVVADGEPARNVHLAFPAAHDATVDAFHAALLAAGYVDNGPPGERPDYHAGYYGAFVLDPDGNNVELVNHNR